QTVEEQPEVHRVVLAWRAWDLLPILGRDHAHTLLRESLHYCVKAEAWVPPYREKLAALLVKLLDRHRLLSRKEGKRKAEDAWVGKMCSTLFKSTPEQAAEAVAAALAEGFEPDALGEAITLAANQLVLRDVGRLKGQVQPGKPVGSVHGDSIGVHAC